MDNSYCVQPYNRNVATQQHGMSVRWIAVLPILSIMTPAEPLFLNATDGTWIETGLINAGETGPSFHLFGVSLGQYAMITTAFAKLRYIGKTTRLEFESELTGDDGGIKANIGYSEDVYYGYGLTASKDHVLVGAFQDWGTPQTLVGVTRLPRPTTVRINWAMRLRIRCDRQRLCARPLCGDGIVQPAEDCDDGNDINTDECTNECASPRCGDGIVYDGIEECDDGNTIDTDGCTNACTIARCGDGVVQLGIEQCDDGNSLNSDNCSTTCDVLSNFSCQVSCNQNATYQGAALVQTRSIPSDLVPPNSGAELGRDVSISGNLAIAGVIGDSGEPGQGYFSGAAYVYQRTNVGGWQEPLKCCQTQILKKETALVGQSTFTQTRLSSARKPTKTKQIFYVFQKQINTWTQTAVIDIPDTIFGNALELVDESTLVVSLLDGQTTTHSIYHQSEPGIWTQRIETSSENISFLMLRSQRSDPYPEHSNAVFYDPQPDWKLGARSDIGTSIRCTSRQLWRPSHPKGQSCVRIE